MSAVLPDHRVEERTKTAFFNGVGLSRGGVGCSGEGGLPESLPNGSCGTEGLGEIDFLLRFEYAVGVGQSVALRDGRAAERK